MCFFIGGGGGLRPNIKHFVSPNIAVQNVKSVHLMFYSDSIISGVIVRQMLGCSQSNFRKPRGKGLWTLILWNRCAGVLYVSKIWISDTVCKSNNNIKLASRIVFFDLQTSLYFQSQWNNETLTWWFILGMTVAIIAGHVIDFAMVALPLKSVWTPKIAFDCLYF